MVQAPAEKGASGQESCAGRPLVRLDQAQAGQLRSGGAGADLEGMLAVIALREIRESIRDAGLQPPRLPRELACIDDPDS